MEKPEVGKSRKEWKKSARKVVKTHYFLFLILAVVAIVYGTEFTYVKEWTQDIYSLINGEEVTLGLDSIRKAPEEKDSSATSDVLALILEGKAEEGHERADRELQEYEDEGVTNAVKGRSGGILASVANTISSGKFLVIIYEGIDSMVNSSKLSSALVVLLSVLVDLSFWVFIRNMITAILRRTALEARMYANVPIKHILYFSAVKKWFRTSITLFVTRIFNSLWWLTVIGGIIKDYSYKMVPYVISENPSLGTLEAIRLSCRIMKGHKWECFKLDLSLMGWRILGFLTLGFVFASWTQPYVIATMTEYYVYVREKAIENGVEGTEKLNDTYLYEYADEALLRGTYSDIEEQKKYIDEHRVEISGVRGFIVKNFGIWFGSIEEKNRYEDVDNRRQQIAEDRSAIKWKIYPMRLSPLWNEKYRSDVKSLNYLRTYTIWSIVLVFFVFSIIGWGWEVSIHLVQDGVFVNRGVTHGPWLPIYGGGVSLILVLLARWRKDVVNEVALIVILCGIVEYMTSLVLELTNGIRWWDYTGYFLNLNGRVCAEGLLVFAIGGMAAIYFIVPLLDSLWSKMNPKLMEGICIVLILLFTADLVYTSYVPNVGEGITDYTAFEEAGQSGR